MASGTDREAEVLDAIREALGLASLSREEALQHDVGKLLLRTLLPSGQVDRPAQSLAQPKTAPPDVASLIGREAGLRAALEDTFELAQLQPTDEERHLLLNASDLVTVDGQRRLRLRDRIRADILDAAHGDPSYMKRLETAVRKDQHAFNAISGDPVRLRSAWIRCMLSGEMAELDGAPLSDLRAALDARKRVAHVTHLPAKLPTESELAVRVDLGELLEPLRILTGEQGGWQREPRTDRFVGREAEIRHLRAFVDELRSAGILEAATRFGRRAHRAVTGAAGAAVLMVQGRGGLGKSTLLAKFVLDHARGESRQFPFVYLDFDRAGIDAERPHQLLMEAARQVGLQFPAAQQELAILCEDIRADIIRRAGERAERASTSSMDPYSTFAAIVQRHATRGNRAFLLVLDTLEVVQWNAVAVERVGRFIDELRRRGLTELRVVASGRAEVSALWTSPGEHVLHESIMLGPLSPAEATTLATKLGRGLLGKKWAQSWSKVVAGKDEDDPSRREPLSIRVAVDFIAKAEPSDRESAIDEVGRSGVAAGKDFVARLYELRILKHIRDPRAQPLAWPGLVIRRVTREIARDLLAPICGLTPAQALDAFDALEREVWLVTRDGDALRHNPELRARTLPLMRQRDEKRFTSVAAKAVQYFGDRRDRSDGDHLEWIYHRLLLGEDPSTVASDVRPAELSILGRARDDFPQDSPAAVFVAARGSSRRLSPQRIRSLPAPDALHHLSVTSPGSFALDDQTIDEVVLDLSRRLPVANLGQDLTPWARVLWIKTGRWSVLPASLPFPAGAPNPVVRAVAYWAGRSAPLFNPRLADAFIGDAIDYVETNQEKSGVRLAVHVLALARLYGSDAAFAAIDSLLERVLDLMNANPTESTQAALRTAIVLGERSRAPALEVWLGSRRYGTGQRVRQATMSLAELRALARIYPDTIDLAKAVRENEGNVGKRFADPATVTSASRALTEVLGQLRRDGAEDKLGIDLSRMFAARDEDWVVPLGYAAAAVFHLPPDEIVHLVGSYAPRSESRGTLQTADMLVAARIADEAGELTGFLRSLVASVGEQAPHMTDLLFLLDRKDDWSRRVQDVLGRASVLSHAAQMPRDTDVRPPAPGPILDEKDPQKGRWGGLGKRDGRSARAVLESVERDLFYFSVVVESVDGSLLEPPLVFHMHSTYPRSVVTVRRILDGRQAVLSDWNAYGVFAIGVQVRDAKGRWTQLEVDLRELEELPARFLKR